MNVTLYPCSLNGLIVLRKNFLSIADEVERFMSGAPVKSLISVSEVPLPSDRKLRNMKSVWACFLRLPYTSMLYFESPRSSIWVLMLSMIAKAMSGGLFFRNSFSGILTARGAVMFSGVVSKPLFLKLLISSFTDIFGFFPSFLYHL